MAHVLIITKRLIKNSFRNPKKIQIFSQFITQFIWQVILQQTHINVLLFALLICYSSHYDICYEHILPSVLIKIPRNETYKKYIIFSILNPWQKHEKKPPSAEQENILLTICFKFFIFSFQSKLLFFKNCFKSCNMRKAINQSKEKLGFSLWCTSSTQKNNKKLINLYTTQSNQHAADK